VRSLRDTAIGYVHTQSRENRVYGLRHHVEGEQGLPGNPEPMNPVRYTAYGLLVGAVVAGCLGFSGWMQGGSGLLKSLCIILVIGGVGALVYESRIQDRISHWRR
jgi:hypothetical protein